MPHVTKKSSKPVLVIQLMFSWEMATNQARRESMEIAPGRVGRGWVDDDDDDVDETRVRTHHEPHGSMSRDHIGMGNNYAHDWRHE